MKNRATVGLLAVLAVAMLASCSQDTGRIQLRLRLQKGDSYRARVVTAQQILQTVRGQQQHTTQKIAVEYDFTPGETDPDGVVWVQVRYRSLKLRQEGPLAVIEYDTSVDLFGRKGRPDNVELVLRGFVGQGFSMKISRSGNVKEVRGADALLTAVLDKLGAPPGPTRAAIEASLIDQFDDQAVREAMENITAIYPDTPVALGDSWTRRIVISKGLPVVLDNVWKLTGRKDGISTVGVRSKVYANTQPPRAERGGFPAVVDGLPLSFDLSGNQEGTVELREATGWIVSAKIVQALSGNVTAGGISWPISIDSIVTIESIER